MGKMLLPKINYIRHKQYTHKQFSSPCANVNKVERTLDQEDQHFITYRNMRSSIFLYYVQLATIQNIISF